MGRLGYWKERAARALANYKIFDVSSSDRESEDGRRGTFYLVNSLDWAGVIPVVDAPEGRMIVMIRQYRHGTRRLCLEFPGGAVEEGANGPALVIEGRKGVPRRASFLSRDDHRVAMSAAVLALTLPPGCDLDDPGVVSKSYPEFFPDWERLTAR